MANPIYFYYAANWLFKKNIPILPTLIEYIIFLFFNCKVSASSRIGKGSKFSYGCIIHPDVILGRNCIIGSNVVINGRLSLEGLPKIGNNVSIGDGVKILGPLRVGHNVIIEPNSLVLKDVNNDSVIEGIPAQVVFINESIFVSPAFS